MKANTIQKLLDKYVPNPTIPLHFTDPFTLLIAVLLSAQCTDDRVNKTTEQLFAKARTPEQMAQLPLDEIEAIIHSCGLAHTKAKNIKQLSTILIKKFGGQVPKTFAALESLPGVGHKTASVVMVQAFHRPAFPVDTHVFRVAHRWGLSQGKTVLEVEKDLKNLFPKKKWGKIHLQMILFARQYCRAKSHLIDLCPICSFLNKSILPQ